MKTIWKDLIATVLVAVIGAAYIGYLVDADVPLVEDARGMSGIGLVLGIAAYLVLRLGDETDRLGMTEIAVALISLTLGVIALALAETAAAEVLLAVFMGSIGVVWLMEVADHVGVLRHQHAHV